MSVSVNLEPCGFLRIDFALLRCEDGTTVIILYECPMCKDGISWFEAKTNIIRDAVRAYLAEPIYTLNPTAQLLIYDKILVGYPPYFIGRQVL